MAKFCLLLFLAGAAALAANEPYSARPLQPRTPAAAGAKPFEILSAAETGVTVPNVYNDPRMWGDRFRELTLGAVETGIAVADFDRDGAAGYLRRVQERPVRALPAGRALQVHRHRRRRGRGLRRTRLQQDGRHRRRHQPGRLRPTSTSAATTPRTCSSSTTATAPSPNAPTNTVSMSRTPRSTAVFADYDGDGFLDCYLVTNILDFSKSSAGPPGLPVPQQRQRHLHRRHQQGRHLGPDPGPHRHLVRRQPGRLARPLCRQRLRDARPLLPQQGRRHLHRCRRRAPARTSPISR